MNNKSKKILLVGTLGFLGLTMHTPFPAEAKRSAVEKKEARFHQIYQQMNVNPTPEDEWKKVLNSGNTQTYTVQEGDTLWDISETLFGDPQFYPKVWSLNGQDILNPHEISPELVVHFTEGTLGEPPSLELKQAMNESDAGSSGGTSGRGDAGGVSVNEEEIPPPVVHSKPYHALPSSVPPWIPNPGSVEDFIFQIDERVRLNNHPETYLEAYLQEGEMGALGTVAETEAGNNVIGEQSYIYIKMNEKPSQNRFLVVKSTEKVTDPESGKVAQQILVLAQVELGSLVNASKNLYRARVVQIVNQIEIGAQVILGEIPLMSAKEESAPQVFPSQIIGGAFSSERRLFGTGDIVFLNRGSEKGLSAGAILPVYKKHSLRSPTTESVESPLLIGHLKVLKVTNSFSAAVVTGSKEELKVGDTTSNSFE